MARINVEQKALTDPRFDLLGRFLQATRHDALGRMILVWNECQERDSYTLPERLVGAIMGDRDGAAWVVEADLAVWVNKETVRIRGTQGRIEWLATKRESARTNGKKGGRPQNPSETGTGCVPDTSRFPAETPPAPAPAPAPAQGGNPPSEDTLSEPPPPAGVCESEILNEWNKLGQPFPNAISITGRRKKSIQARLKEPWWVENWWLALSKIRESPFLRGESQSGWVADIDWFLRPDTVQKIIEGKYSNVAKSSDTLMSSIKANTMKFLEQNGHDAD